MTESFEDAIKALRHIARGNGSVLRIADRIVAAHERELAAAKLAAEMPTYDVEGNERHKAACELRDMKIGKLSTHWNFVCSLAARLNIPRPNDEPYEDYELHELIRDKLVNLLEGECNFSTPESYMACEDGDPNPAEMSPDEQTSVTLGTRSPITGELRDAMRQWGWVESDGSITFATSPTPPSIDAEKSLAVSGSDFDRCCDAIDSIHAQLEREYDELRMKYVNINRHAQHVERENESLKAELDRVLEEDEHDGWVRLPVDADGVPIRFKDKVTVPWSDKVYEVSGFSYQENVHTGTMTIWINTHIDGKYRALCATDSCHHHEPDTWERILADALGCEPYEVEGDDDLMALVARCKALAGDAE